MRCQAGGVINQSRPDPTITQPKMSRALVPSLYSGPTEAAATLASLLVLGWGPPEIFKRQGLASTTICGQSYVQWAPGSTYKVCVL